MRTVLLSFPNCNGTGPATLLAGPEVSFDEQMRIVKAPGPGRRVICVIEERITVIGTEDEPDPIVEPKPKTKKSKSN